MIKTFLNVICILLYPSHLAAMADVLTAAKGIASLVSAAMSLCNQLQRANINKERFVELADHVKDVKEVLEILANQGVDEGAVKKGLKTFKRALKSAEKLLQDYESSNRCMHFIRARGMEGRFARVNNKLSKAKQYLTLVLQLEQREQNQANECIRKEDEESKGEHEVMVTRSSNYSC